MTPISNTYRNSLSRRLRAAMRVAAVALLLSGASGLQAQVVVKGTVYGGGKGLSDDPQAAQVFGNATVNMSGGTVERSVYGGGELASVGTFTYTDTDNPVSCAESTGVAKVVISAGVVGQKDKAYMPKPGTPAKDDDIGFVFCAGRGEADSIHYSKANRLAVVDSTYLEISGTALITASAYGGSENGQVLRNTYVYIRGGQIGIGYDPKTNKFYDPVAEPQWDTVAARLRRGAYTDADTAGFRQCDSWHYDTVGARMVYDIEASEYGNYVGYKLDAAGNLVEGAATDSVSAGGGSLVATDGHSFYGNVFGGGSGYYPVSAGLWRRTAGRVCGNTKVVIEGGHILNNVYGGNEITDVLGSSSIVMTGGTVGVPRTRDSILAKPMNGLVFGGGMGDPRTWANQWSNVGSSSVAITGSAVVFGSVFGGGEDGHVMRNASTTIGGDAVIGTYGSTGFDGNVFGGGRGFSAIALTAGVVCGDIELNIEGGHILGSAYGGGRLAAVGTYLVPAGAEYYGMLIPDDGVGADADKAYITRNYLDGTHGNITVNVSGGTIGNASEMYKMYNTSTYKNTVCIGDVFGGSKGTMETDSVKNQRLGLCKNTAVNVSGSSTLIRGDVYGGGEIASVGAYQYATAAEAETYNSTHTGFNMVAYDVLDSISGMKAGTARVTVTGGTIGIASDDVVTSSAVPSATQRRVGRSVNRKGHVFGGCLGKAGTQYSGYSFVNHSIVTIGTSSSAAPSDSAFIVGSVFGGGENGHVLDSTIVRIYHGLIGQELKYDDTDPNISEHYEKDGQGHEIFFGNVYGGGRGIDTVMDKVGDENLSLTAGRVRGNTRVEMSGGRVTHNVYGGGSLASTGIASIPNSGYATVVIDGNAVVGYATPDYAKAGINEGRVYGSARGEAGNVDGTYSHMAFTKHTDVTVGGQAKVRGSVFGGGANGHVRHDTHVTIADNCEIGVQLKDGDDYEDPQSGVGPTVYRGNVYGGGRGVDTTHTTGQQHHSATAGRVYGNTYVYITGGTIYHAVYGGGSLASVGDTIHKVEGGLAYDILDSVINGSVPEGYHYGKYVYRNPGGSVTERDYEPGDPITNSGRATIRMVGGQIGVDGINQGRIYGSGRGVAGENTSEFTHLAFTHNTFVQIADSIKDGSIVSTPYVTGSVFGGGANGHVTQNTSVDISGGYIGYGAKTIAHIDNSSVEADALDLDSLNEEFKTDRFGIGKTVFRGNVYGGGRGVDPTASHTLSMTAGRVYGNTNVKVWQKSAESKPYILHGIYGGGSLASVGDTLKNGSFKDSTGHATVVVNGGQVGWNGRNNGQVYGSGRGMAAAHNTSYFRMAYTNNTSVTVDSTALVTGSVFGGGANGHVNKDTYVYIKGGEVGLPITGDDDVINQRGIGTTHYHGNVYGGGRGVDRYDGDHVSSTAGRVYGNTNVTITGGTIYHNVYGGGSLASVGDTNADGTIMSTAGKATINIHDTNGHGPQIGTTGNNNGHVFGSSRGMTGVDHDTVYVTDLTGLTLGSDYRVISKVNEPSVDSLYVLLSKLDNTKDSIVSVDYTHLSYVRETEINISATTPMEDSKVLVMGSVFGSGENGHVQEDTYVNISGGIIGHELSYTSGSTSELSDNQMFVSHLGTGAVIYRGNVYGGGRGVDVDESGDVSLTAGAVLGNTNVTVSGGTVRHAVYGGGSLASVGTYDRSQVPLLLCQDSTGKATVIIKGNAYIGNHYVGGEVDSTRDGFNNGEVYGSGRGMAAESGNYLSLAAFVCETDVRIEGGKVCGSVFGGGSNGHVLGDSKVTMTGGTVGTQLSTASFVFKDKDTTIALPFGEACTTGDGIDPMPVYRGNLYGGGRGVDNKDANGKAVLSLSAGRVYGDTYVTVKGGTVVHNVYGGGSLASVGRTFYKDSTGAYSSYTPVPLRAADKASFVSAASDQRRMYRDSEGNYTSSVPTADDSEGQIRYKDATYAFTLASPAYYDVTGRIVEGGAATVLIDSVAQIGSAPVANLNRKGLNNGRVFGSGRGMANRDYNTRAYTRTTSVTVQGSAVVNGSVFGSGENGHVQNDALVTILGGTIGHDVTSDYAFIDTLTDSSPVYDTVRKYMNSSWSLDDVKDELLRRLDNIGNVYGAGRGLDVANDGIPFHAGYVRGNTTVNILGGTIYHNVYGGGSMAIVGNYGLYGDADEWMAWKTEYLDKGLTLQWDDVDDAQRDYLFGNYGGLATVNIHSSVGHSGNPEGYGGNVFGSSRGKANKYSGSYTYETHPHEDYSDMAYVVRSVVNVGHDTATDFTVYGSVYGGGENGHVDFGGTEVNIFQGTVLGNVFGGGKGSASSPSAGIVDGNTQVNIGTADQDANTVVIGGSVYGGNDANSCALGTMRVDVYKTAHSGANIFPAGVPNHGEAWTAADSALVASLMTESVASQPSNYALKAVYGGGNRASVLTGDAETDAGDWYDATFDRDPVDPDDYGSEYKYISQRITKADWPVSTQRNSVVYVHNCDNTIMYVYGGGSAADSRNTSVTIEGGRIFRAFAGGDGYSETNNRTDPSAPNYNPGANIRAKIKDKTVDYVNSTPFSKSSGDVAIDVQGGVVYEVFGGSNQMGVVEGNTSISLTPTGPCQQFIHDEVFGGGNEAEGNGGTITLECGTHFNTFYGGARNANITDDIVLNILGGTFDTVFGGNKEGGIISGNVTVNVSGGHIGSLFGGSNRGGDITGVITVNVDLDPDYSCADGLQLDYVYGGGKNAAYPSVSTPTPTLVSPVVNILCDSVSEAKNFRLQYVYGGGYGDGATVTAHPFVTVGDTTLTGKHVVVYRDIYGGGALAPVVGNPTVRLTSKAANSTDPSVVSSSDNTTSAHGNVFGGGFGPSAVVTGNTSVDIRGNRTSVDANVYGGGNAGRVSGNTSVTIGDYVVE